MALSSFIKPYKSINSYYDFVQYCLRSLGGGAFNIELTDDQIEDRITDALQFVREFNVESVKDKYPVHPCTAEEATQGYIQLPLDVLDLQDVLIPSVASGTPAIDNIDAVDVIFWNQFWQTGIGVGATSTPLSGLCQYYECIMQQLDTIQKTMTPVVMFDYRPRERKVTFYKERILENKLFAFHVTTMIDPEKDDTIWENIFLKKYATALLGEQWGRNLSKYANTNLLGGLQVNSDDILAKYSELRRTLEEEHKARYEAPPAFFFA